MVKFLKNAYLYLVLAFLYAPIAVLIIFSFNEGRTRVWRSFRFSFAPYRALFSNEKMMSALIVTFSIALGAAVISTVIGTVSAIGLFKSSSLVRNALMSATYLPMMNSDIVTGVSLMLMFSALRVPLGWGTLLMSHVTFCIPYVIVSVLPKLFQINASVYEAARDLGANAAYAYRRIIIPEIMPGVVSGFLLSITLSIDDFMISFFNTGRGVQNISTYIYTARRGIGPEINALSAIIFSLILILMIFINRHQNKGRKRSAD